MPKKAKEKVAPCPYCADPALLDAPKGKPDEKTYPVLHSGGRFWRKEGAPSVVDAFSYGRRWVAPVPSEYFAPAFSGFSARVVGVEAGFFIPDPGRPPAPFGNHILMLLRDRLPLVPPPAESSNPQAAYIIFSGCVIEHEAGGVEVRAHWWPSHGWIINQRVTLTASDPAERNAQLGHAYTALDFFLLETRGAPKITEAALAQALVELGPDATQVAAANNMGVSESALEKWRQRQGIKTWQEVIDKFMSDAVIKS
ncbi:MAG TPA: hypothetical protein VF611_07985 [Pyrinomonadaceae bacterium]|jgi:hypothetical protein